MRAALVVLLLAACDKPAAETVGSAPIPQPSPSASFYGEPLPSAWWARDKPCPAGAALAGAPSPSSKRVYCALPDGTAHGPSTTWSVTTLRDGDTYTEVVTDRINFQGTYRDGKRDGLFESWASHGPLLEVGGYRAGQRQGRHEVYSMSGKLLRVERYEDGKLLGVER